MSWLQLFAEAGCRRRPAEGGSRRRPRLHPQAAGRAGDSRVLRRGGGDGIYAPETVAAVESLQQAHGLPVTGTV
ncbi:peptidoglycan-binding protein, partial [Nocardioides guangzhouensis]|uniref:peptidoglycan-binding domain-containing protein n=1 Tax=Nocardioides guangzhouensis TaxID=2497878 RepID=UPI001C376CE4